MWLLRFHLVETRDYNRVDRFCREVDFLPKKFSAMLLVKGALLHVFQKKSWRQIGAELDIPHLPLYNFYTQIHDREEFRELLTLFIDRRIALSIADERNITREYLETEEILWKSHEELERLF